MNYWKLTLILFGILPICFAVSLFVFYVHAAAVLGYSPRYDMPDPKTLLIYNAYAPWIYFSSICWMWLLPVWSVVMVVYFIVCRKSISVPLIAYSFLAQILGAVMLFSGVFEWFVD